MNITRILTRIFTRPEQPAAAAAPFPCRDFPRGHPYYDHSTPHRCDCRIPADRSPEEAVEPCDVWLDRPANYTPTRSAGPWRCSAADLAAYDRTSCYCGAPVVGGSRFLRDDGPDTLTQVTDLECAHGHIWTEETTEHVDPAPEWAPRVGESAAQHAKRLTDLARRARKLDTAELAGLAEDGDVCHCGREWSAGTRQFEETPRNAMGDQVLVLLCPRGHQERRLSDGG